MHGDSRRGTKNHLVVLIVVAIGARAMEKAEGGRPEAADAGAPARIDRVSPEFLEAWKAKGANAVVVPLDEAAKPRWKPLAELSSERV